ncbi:DNA primase [Jannaschia rubra]|uniref:DNA primase n=1 Tax=Jannaschia rubra TaxID=282197 RepID=A0A0M6XST8_9RHOB|nr:DNA primase [Jannaschia rubra]CTQ33878.1 DNA primase [Jannaschia rubra]SFG11498.1 DNA primase [Jannaschia rubra]
MRLPDSFLDDLRNRLSLSQVVGRRVTWDMKKTNQAKGDWWAPCPFHQEKSPSFHVDDRKGFYYCFGCQAKGNVFGFVQETENVGFMEAVEILAAEAGMPMPARDPRAAEKADLRTRLAEVTEQAVAWFRLQLKTGAAAEARAYLDRRGLTPATLDRFEIGFAPDTSDAFVSAMADRGVPFDLLEGAGLAVPPEDGRPARDRFIHRIVFPIRDPRGRCIGFGGRAMNPNAKAKYLNSPETALFDKGSNLYNLGPARAAAGKGQKLVVAEGYMDVIALAQAGFDAAVAPLGTAVTERQLQMLWRVTPEPLIALDGDAAGQRAGLRVADLALPLIEAGQSLRFAVLPEGQDPDDLIRARGAAAMQAVLDEARPMLSLLWQREVEGKSFDSPERRAMLDRDLRALLHRIKDPMLRRHYGEEIARLRADLFGTPLNARQDDRPFQPRPRTPWVPGRRWQPPPAPPSVTARASALASGTSDPDLLLEQVALAGFVRHPSLIAEFAHDLETVPWTGGHGRLAAALLSLDPGGDMRAAIDAELGPQPLETLFAQRHLGISPVTRADANGARHCIRDALDRLDARRGADRERREAIEDFDESADEAMTWRLAQASRRREETQRARRDEDMGSDDDVGLSDYLQGLLDTKVWEKTKKK